MAITKLTYRKERSFDSGCLIFLKFCFSIRTCQNFYVADPPVTAMICRLTSSRYTSLLLVHFLWNFPLIRPVDQHKRQMKVIFYSRCCIMGSGVGILTRRIRLAMNDSGGGIMNYTIAYILWF